MIEKINLENILFLDIETVPEEETFTALDEEKKELFDLKTQYQRKEQFTAEEFYDRAGIWAEFGKIVCISVGYFTFKGDIRHFRVTSFFGDEQKILGDFTNLLENYFAQPQHILCGHNAKEFDFPFIARRMIINQVKIPGKLNLFGKKPWEIPHLDTMELWKFGDFKHYTSLKLMAKILNIPSPKDDISGSDVGHVYYVEKDIDRIITYCEKDVITVAQILLRFRREDLLIEDEIIHI
ncbi:MAG: 3'-5' exonuclease [Flavobacterium lindanitolerans]|jgi:DNA polymerase elongation subunit (family B)|uniref:3'-5' exonuclease n=1 Tax=Flavobacterium TaxID=237 RepID=UPI0006F8A556|nr:MULTISPECIES: 3'-5' exonuclease [Flavobacterium]MBU7571118.1 3'-5' exonuclease [Flavobacterium sp.]PZO31650.1 MAG: 3'-5' exonuclease [Flavobacteriaceae bacterium]PZQ90157.1 MAG: 3'-5' exonuclease [Flavobacterium johnsoniae]KQS52812.1 3'-5' exonuclease [Flavobacterium sp. Leaf359]MBL7867809.1 3'-5' exonuclease [Flavobacterium lindanitolerans]